MERREAAQETAQFPTHLNSYWRCESNGGWVTSEQLRCLANIYIYIYLVLPLLKVVLKLKLSQSTAVAMMSRVLHHRSKMLKS